MPDAKGTPFSPARIARLPAVLTFWALQGLAYSDLSSAQIVEQQLLVTHLAGGAGGIGLLVGWCVVGVPVVSMCAVAYFSVRHTHSRHRFRGALVGGGVAFGATCFAIGLDVASWRARPDHRGRGRWWVHLRGHDALSRMMNPAATDERGRIEHAFLSASLSLALIPDDFWSFRPPPLSSSQGEPLTCIRRQDRPHDGPRGRRVRRQLALS